MTATRPRLSRADWTDAALAAMAAAGTTGVNVEQLARSLGATKGSFYHHFSGKQDFQRALVAYWDRHYTEIIVHLLDEMPESAAPEERLMALARSVWQLDYGKLELAVRTMAQDDQELTELVQRVEATRYENVGRLFEAMGFTGVEKHVRTHAFVILTGREDLFGRPDLGDDPEEHLQARLAFFTRP